jgi:hypothetical protein
VDEAGPWQQAAAGGPQRRREQHRLVVDAEGHARGHDGSVP